MRYEASQPQQAESWGHLTWMVNQARGNSDALTVGRVTIHAGRSNPRHRHPSCEEVLHLLVGELEHTLGDACVRMTAGDTLVIPPGVYHNATNVGSHDADMVVVYSTAERDFELEGDAAERT
jgi:quercetin dioxygenase-like cupin family protein